MAFATPAQLILQYDSRRVRELASDSGAPVAAGDIATDEVILTALERATEMILMAARQGEEYTEDELQELADDINEDGKGYALRGLTCDLAFGLLVMRRGTGAADLDRLSPAFGAAQQTLQMLRDGYLIFPRVTGDEHADAGTPRTADLNQQITTPSLSESWSAQAIHRLNPTSPLIRNLTDYAAG